MKSNALARILRSIWTAPSARPGLDSTSDGTQPDAGPADKDRRDEGLAKATQAYLLYVTLPIWTVAGFGDWICHRRTKIETTSGTHESLTHSLMMAAIGLPATMGLLLETNASTLVAQMGGFVIHEAIVLWDVSYAAGRRRVTTTEQHLHSFLEVLPFMSLSFMLCLQWDQVLAMIGKGPARLDYSLRLKESPIHPLYLTAMGTILTSFLAVPYAEEFVRCFRVDHTLAPHAKAPSKPNGEPPAA